MPGTASYTCNLSNRKMEDGDRLFLRGGREAVHRFEMQQKPSMRRASSVTPARILQTCGCKLWLKAKYQVAENSWSCAGSPLQGANVALCSGDVNKVYIDSPWAWLDFLTQQISFLSVLEGSHGEKHTS